MRDTTPTALHLADDGVFPNSRLPVLLWRGAIPTDGDTAAAIEDRFHASGWGGAWRNGIFDFHHYHASAHEALGIARGSVTVLLGGPNGQTVELAAGDVVLLPAGTPHRNLAQSDDLLVIGAYPHGQRPDMRHGEPGERPAADRSIAGLPLPETDPVSGAPGPPVAWRET
jgi:uncharacterized protein YjlB